AAPGSFIRAINQDGSVVTAVDQGATPSGWTDDGAVVRLSTGTDNVGVGTAAPLSNLHIFEDVNADVGLRIENPNAGLAAQERIDFGDGAAHINVLGSTNEMSIVNNRTSGTLGFHVGGTSRLFIGNSGNVGIGTLGTANKLDVEGGAAVGANYSGSFTAPANGLLVEGQVGIGTSSPTKKLEVVGSVKADTVFSNVLSSNSPLSLQAPAGTTRAYIADVTGYLGIGTTAPQRNLHIFQDANTSVGLRIENPNVGGVAQERIDFGNSGLASITVFGASNGMSIVNNRTSGLIDFETGGTTRVRIANNGRVAIGTLSQQNTLDVGGNAAIGSFFAGTAAPVNGLLVEGSVGIGTNTPSAKLHINRASGQGLPGDLLNEGLVVNNNAASVDIASVNVIGGTTGSGRITFGDNASAYAGYINYSNATDALQLGTGGLNRVHIASAGDVGIGTAGPSARLHVNRGSGQGLPGDLLNEGVVVNNNAAAVDIASVNVIGGTAGSGRISFGDNTSAYAGYVTYSNATDAMQVGTGGLTRMHISSTGNVGIGTTAPSAKLDVAGSVEIGGGTPIVQVLSLSAVIDFPLTAAQSSSEVGLGVAGAAVGDVISLGISGGGATTLTNSCYTAYCNVAGTVTIRYNNYSAAAQNPASGTFRVMVTKF
ncbi:MAG: hypothetical protein L0196_01380, partial [candidate division Zixibacteria bacterium]|nr:hypothetical protein [candidate division Zixibacteria bacterium]